MRRIEELIQYRAQYKIDLLSNERDLRLRPKLTELIEKRTGNRASRSWNVIR
jgi:Ni,Fe-hydrogenase III large subunit